MQKSINGFNITVTMTENNNSPNATNYKEKYGKMLPGYSYIKLHCRIECPNNNLFVFGQINHGNYASFIEPFKTNDDGIIDYELIDKNTYTQRDNIIEFDSYVMKSRIMDDYGRYNYVVVGVQDTYENSGYFVSFAITDFDMFEYVDPKIEILNIKRNNNIVTLNCKVGIFFHMGIMLDVGSGFILLKYKDINDSDFKINNLLYDMDNTKLDTDIEQMDTTNGFFYSGSMEYKINIETDNSYVCFFEINAPWTKISYPLTIIPALYQLLCFGKDGNAIAFGKICEQEGFENNLSSIFYKDTIFNDRVKFNKPPSGIPSNNIVISDVIKSDNLIEQSFGDIHTTPTAKLDDKMYPYKKTYWINPTKYGITMDMLTQSIIDIYPDTSYINICPRAYNRVYGDLFELQILFGTRPLPNDIPVKILITLVDTFEY